MSGLAVVLACGGAARADAGPGVTAARIEAEVLTRSDRGQVLCALFAGADASAYPTRGERARGRAAAPIRAGRAVCSFVVEPGEYAIAVVHDENGNGRVDTGIFGIPTEGTGASNDARGTFGPPSFADARFAYRGGVLGLRVRVRY